MEFIQNTHSVTQFVHTAPCKMYSIHDSFSMFKALLLVFFLVRYTGTNE